VDIETNVALTDDKHEIINRYPNNAIAQESRQQKEKIRNFVRIIPFKKVLQEKHADTKY